MKVRHIGFNLRHLLQANFPLFIVHQTQHSVLQPRGIAERSYVTCAGARSKAEITFHIVHEGPIDAREGKEGERGVVAVSQAYAWAGEYDRREMLWKRSRRIGALACQNGAFDWEISHPEDCGREADEEVFLLEKHMKFLGGGVASKGFVSSHSVARHPYLYMTSFEAPPCCAIDTIQQLHHRNAVNNEMVADGEKLISLAWVVQSPWPFLALEADMHFDCQVGRPEVYMPEDKLPHSAIGFPFVGGAPLQSTDWCITQGNPDYVFDESPAHRPWNWWQQQRAENYYGSMWCTRESHLDKLEIKEDVRNPFDAKPRQQPPDDTPKVKGRKRNLTSRLKKHRASPDKSADAMRRAAAEQSANSDVVASPSAEADVDDTEKERRT